MTQSTQDRSTLELRVHGVNNTAPPAMLERPAAQIEQLHEDPLGGRWRIVPPLVDGRTAGEPGHVPDGVQRDAYSWGGLARTSPGARVGSVVARVLNTAGRIGWAMLIPFGLANVAYWSRAEIGQNDDGRGAGLVRIFGLGLTVLFVITTCSVALDVVALQCWGGVPGGCTLPTPIDGPHAAAVRVAVASLVPILVLVGLWLLARQSRVRYEERLPARRSTLPAAGEHGAPVLSRSTLWAGGPVVRTLTWLHFAAGASVVVLATAWPAMFGRGGRCTGLRDVLSEGCRAQIAGEPWQVVTFGTTGLLAVVVLAAAVWLTWRDRKAGPDLASGAEAPRTPSTRAACRLALVAGLLFVAEIVLLCVSRPTLASDGGVPGVLPGTTAAPALVVAVLLAIAVHHIGRAAAPRSSRLAGGLVGVGALLTHFSLWFGVVAIAGLGIAFGLARWAGGEERELRSWGGTAPGLLLGLSLLVAMTLSSLVELVAADLLRPDQPSASLVTCSGTQDVCVPRTYLWFGSATVVSLVALAAVALVVVELAWGRWYAVRPPENQGGEQSPAVTRYRFLASLAHRAEPAAGLLARTGLVMTTLAVAGSVVRPADWTLPSWVEEGGADLAAGAVAASALAGAGVVAMFVGGAALGNSRPLGLVWDLICFLPRAAHPFGPPCYAERAVPELEDDVVEHLERRGPVVLSAHSLGAVLAVAVLMQLRRDELAHVSMLSYGVQLRPYFGRLFPGLLGPDVVGTAPCGPPSLWRADPWARADRPAPAGSSPPSGSLAGRLGPRWTNLWRRTDYLGFRAFAPRSRHDVVADELVDGKVGTHSGYPVTRQYRSSLHALTTRRGDATRGPAATAALIAGAVAIAAARNRSRHTSG